MAKGDSYRKGQVALPFVLLVSGIVIEVAVAGMLVAYFLSVSNVGDRLALRAQSAAYSGLQDALLKISQNKETASGGTSSYSLTVASDSAAVSIARSTDSVTNSYVFTVTSTGTASSRQKKLVASVLVNKTTGEARVKSVEDRVVQ